MSVMTWETAYQPVYVTLSFQVHTIFCYFQKPYSKMAKCSSVNLNVMGDPSSD